MFYYKKQDILCLKINKIANIFRKWHLNLQFLIKIIGILSMP